MNRLVRLALALSLCALAAPAAHATGLLLPTDTQVTPFALKHQRVDIQVKDGTAVTKVEQVFVNHTDRPLEAQYLFPVPTEAVVVDFHLLVNGRMQKGEVLPKDKANQIYTDIVRRMVDPGIIDWMSPNLFKARIFPVPPRGEQKVEVTYTQVVPFMDGTYKLVYPLKTPARAAKTLQDFTLTATLQHATPIKAVYSPTHRISVARRGDHQATVGFEGNEVTLDTDFVLYFGISKKDVGLTLLTHRPSPAEPGYFMLVAAPREVFDSQEIQGKAITFVLDTSGSMSAKAMDHARKALAYCLGQLGSDDRFNIVRFSSDVEAFSEGLLPATRDNVARGQRFVEGFEAAGGTSIDEALKAALATPGDARTPHLVVFMTDGRPTVGQTDIKKILDNAAERRGRDTRLFTFGIGEEVNTHLLDRLAMDGGGTSHYVRPDEDIEAAVSALYGQVAHPVLTGVKLDMATARPYALVPGRVPDLFKGGQLVLVGRYRGDGDSLIRLTGTFAGSEKRYDFEGRFPERQPDNAFLAPLWAHRQVGVLLDQVRLEGETQGLKDEIVQLATRYGIVTPYTSYLVVEDVVTARPDPRPRPLPPRPTLRRERGNFGFGSDADAPAAEEAEASPGKLMSRSAAQGGAKPAEALKKDSGRQGVDNAKVVKHLKDKQTAGGDVATVRYADGRVFRWDGQAWLDTAHRAGMPEVRVAPFSPAWVELAQLRPDLKKALALGERVTVVVGGVAVVVAPDGAKALSASDKQRLAR